MRTCDTSRHGVRRLLGYAGVLALVPWFTSAAPAGAVATCSFNSGTATATVAISDAEIATLAIFRGAIQVNGADCGAATTITTDTIKVNGSGAGQVVAIDKIHGGFGPGKTTEQVGVSEIEVQVNLNGGEDVVHIAGNNGVDNLRLGATGANINGDGDADVISTNVEDMDLQGRGGNDVLSAAGGAGTGAALATRARITGDAGADTITGGAGGDSLDGGLGDDTVNGSGGADGVGGGDGNDTVKGGPDDDSVTGGAGADTVQMGDGTDFYGAASTPDGADSIDGGTGNDFAIYNLRSAPQTLSLDGVDNDGQVGASEHDNLKPSIENVFGGSGPDTITGSAAADHLRGQEGSDHLIGGGGPDILFGEDGADDLEGGPEVDFLDGGDDNDTITGGNGHDTAMGGSGVDTFAMLDGIVDGVDGGLGADNGTFDPFDAVTSVP